MATVSQSRPFRFEGGIFGGLVRGACTVWEIEWRAGRQRKVRGGGAQ